MYALRRLGLAVFVLSVMVGIAALRYKQDQALQHFRIVVGLSDTEPTEWDGQLQLTQGELVSMVGWHFEEKDAVQGSSWQCKTRNNIAPLERYPIQDFAGKYKAKPMLAPWPNGVDVTVKGPAPETTVKLGQGTFSFKAKDIQTGQPSTFLGGKVRVERVPASGLARPAAPLKAEDPYQDDYPALWIDSTTGKQFLAWVCYRQEKTRVLLTQRDDSNAAWAEPIEVAGPGDQFRVALSGSSDGTVWIVWSANVNHMWNLVGRPLRDGKLGQPQPLTKGTGPNLWHRMTTDSKGRAWLVWQAFQDGRSRIFATVAKGDKWTDTIAVSAPGTKDEGLNCWDPVVAADPTSDRVWIGWDEYAGDNYRVRVASVTTEPGEKHAVGSVLAPEITHLFQAHISLACDRQGRVWAAWDEAGPQWGKDTGFLYGGHLRTDTSRLYASRAIRVRCLADGKWQDPAAELSAVLSTAMKEYVELPQLQCDRDGRLWMAFRHRTARQPREDGWCARGRWDVFATAYLGDRWLTPVELAQSGGRNDMRIASQLVSDGTVTFAYASDNRLWSMPGMPPRNHHIAVSRFADAPVPAALKLVSGERKLVRPPQVHPKEAEQVARIRNYKVDIGGRTYKIYRGDLHRHTDISNDGPGDGSLMDLHRYAIDAAAMDFVLVADHNMGDDNEYCWWRTQQANDLYTVPGKFISMYGYERSVRYPVGHRNVIWTERGHRTLPVPTKPLPAVLKADTGRLYDYLRRTGGICTLHTSASDQGTDWSDPHDPDLEPFVELFQGYHTSYEYLGAPKSIDSKTDMIHGIYRQDGFVNLALEKGYKLGFQASSDHISTHLSYACILAEDFSRKGLVDAMKKRHTYAATDNIILDVRLGNNLMGDEVRAAQPTFDVIVLGTAPLTVVEIFRGTQVVHTHRPVGAEARFRWQDTTTPPVDKAAYYYVRVQQQDGNMAWSSPIWVRAAK
jgi:hypothetical protein